MKTLKDIIKVIEETGLTRCESQNCDGCEFDKKSPEYKEFGSFNVCMILNDIAKVK